VKTILRTTYSPDEKPQRPLGPSLILHQLSSTAYMTVSASTPASMHYPQIHMARPWRSMHSMDHVACWLALPSGRYATRALHYILAEGSSFAWGASGTRAPASPRVSI
jgi:hypothetical protein